MRGLFSRISLVFIGLACPRQVTEAVVTNKRTRIYISLQLYGYNDLSIGRLFWYRRFDTALCWLLECVGEFGMFAQRVDQKFRLQYPIEGICDGATEDVGASVYYNCCVDPSFVLTHCCCCLPLSLSSSSSSILSSLLINIIVSLTHLFFTIISFISGMLLTRNLQAIRSGGCL